MDINLSLISPVYCEGKNVISFKAVSCVLKQMQISYEILIVDDGSTDDTWEHIVEINKTDSHIRAIRFARNFGKEAALFAGIDNALGDVVVTIDSDLQHPVELIPKMYEMYLKEKVNMVSCVKEVRQKESVTNKLFALLFYKIFSKLTGIDLRGASDFKLFDRKVINTLKTMPEKNVFFRGMTQWVGLKNETIFFTSKNRVGSTSKWSLYKKFNLALNSLSAYTSKPLLIILLMTFVFFVISVVASTNVIWRYINGTTLGGFLTVIMLICVTGMIILICMSLMAVYISQIFHEVKNRPRYIISEMIADKS
jgi:dolichol-phosphate mannosyltransferase